MLFASIDEVRDWHAKQRDAFSWILGNGTRNAQILSQRIQGQIVAIGNALNNLSNPKGDQHRPLNELATALAQWKDQVGILSTSEIVPTLKHVASVNPELAAKTVLALHRVPERPDDLDDGRLMLTLWRLGLLTSSLADPRSVHDERGRLWTNN